MDNHSPGHSSDLEPISLSVRSHFFDGKYQFQVLPICLIKEIKMNIMVSFYGDRVSSNANVLEHLGLYHRLIGPTKPSHPNNALQLRDLMTVKDAHLNNADELFLIRTLPPITPVSKPKTPRQLEIDELQDQMLENELKREMRKANIPLDQKNTLITALELQDLQSPEFFSDMRRIITTYLEIIIITWCTLSNIPKVAHALETIRTFFLDTLYPHSLNPAFVIEFREMGFSPRRTKYAFFITKHRNQEALEWLKTHKSLDSMKIPEDTSFQTDIDVARKQLEAIPLNDAQLLLELFRDFREYTFKPDMFASNNLQEAGFTVQAIHSALKQGENSYPAAFRILSCEKSKSLTEMSHVSYPNRLYFSMTERLLRHHVLDCKVMLALLSFYREPERIIFGWCWNRETAPIIFEMFETYNLEIQDLYHCDTKYSSNVHFM